MQCSKCHRDAIVFQPYSGLHLCDRHLIADVEAKAKKIIRAQGWLKTGDHIAVLLFGDRSSSALLFFLKKLTIQRRDIKVSAIAIVDRTGTHSDISYPKRIADGLKTDLFEMSLTEESWIGADTITGKKQDISSLPVFPESHSILLDKIAQQHGITKIAWGLCLDEVAGVVLGCVIRGDGEKLVMRSSGQDDILRICPFIAVTAAEISLYANISGVGTEQTPDPEHRDMLHKDTIVMLDAYTNNHPATKYALLNLGENLAGFTTGIAGLIHACEWYGKYQQRCDNDRSTPEDVKYGAN
ncbi:MAG: tRNA(Ile)-lysidine synthase [Methanoregula sp.]